MTEQTLDRRTRSTDEVLKEIWGVKDELSARRGHDIHRLFAEAREREKRSGHRVVNFQTESSSRQEG